ncbi:MAG: endolytic transglycosylase MltG, partial [Anaerolineales bacterium]
MSARRSSLVVFFFLSLATLVCLGGLVGGFVLVGIPPYAARTFGPPAEHLGITQQIRLSIQILWQSDDLTRPMDPNGTQRTFVIELGENIPTIATRLQSEGFIRNASAFSAYLRYSGLDVTLQAGEYLLSPGMTATEIAQHLQDPTPTHVEFNILKGWRAEEIAASLPTSGFQITPDEFLDALENPLSDYEILASIPPGSSLEG